MTSGTPNLSHAEADLRAHLEEPGKFEFERERKSIAKRYGVCGDDDDGNKS